MTAKGVPFMVEFFSSSLSRRAGHGARGAYEDDTIRRVEHSRQLRVRLAAHAEFPSQVWLTAYPNYSSNDSSQRASKSRSITLWGICFVMFVPTSKSGSAEKAKETVRGKRSPPHRYPELPTNRGTQKLEVTCLKQNNNTTIKCSSPKFVECSGDKYF